MFRKTSMIMLTAVLALFITQAAVADGHEHEGVATIVKITPKPGHRQTLVKAITDYHKWMGNFDGAMRYDWFEVLTGPDTGKFYARSGDHNWADFDAENDWDEEAGNVFRTNVRPHVESMQRMMTSDMKDFWHWPENMEGHSHYLVEHWYIKNGMRGQFNRHLGKIVETLKANGYPGYFGFYNVVSGGVGGEVGLVSPNKGWAGMSESDPSFEEVMIKGLGSAEAFEALMTDFGSTFKAGPNMMLRYMPEASDYGD